MITLSKPIRGFNIIFIVLFSAFCQAEPAKPAALFQNRFFTLSTDNSLICTTHKQGYFSRSKLEEIIHFYEQHSPDLQKYSVEVLTDHTHPDHLADLADFRQQCQHQREPDRCVLNLYWDDEDAAARALALFYDTKLIIKHSDDYQSPRFNADHLRVFEKGIRKIPPFLRREINHAKPHQNFNQALENIPIQIRSLIHDAFPKDYDTSTWTDHTKPLMMVPGTGYRGETVAQVFSGQNLIIFTTKAFDKAKDGNLYRDIDLKYRVDFRLPILVHEIAHTIDNFHFWNGKDELFFFYWYRKMSTDSETSRKIRQAHLALWPSRWFEAFEYLWEVNEGRYNGRIQEKLAELFAQYVLIPERLEISSPEAYQWLKNDVFKGIEYQGYDSCPEPVVEPLNFWQDAIARVLGQ